MGETLKTETREYQESRERMDKRLSQLESLRAPWDTVNSAIVKYVLPGAGRFTAGDVNKGERQDVELIDDAGIDALQTFKSGMMSANTSQLDKWFALRPEDPDLGKRYAVQEWLQYAEAACMGAFDRSNTYEMFDYSYEHLGAFGGSSSFMVDDPRTTVHHYMMSLGQFCLATDDRGTVNTCYRKFQMSIDQVVRRWGLQNVSVRTKSAYDRCDYDTMITIVHVVEPRLIRDVTAYDNRNMAWRSCYYEQGISENKTLSESGFETFPVRAPRYATYGGDVYGYGPGRRALGALKQLQQEQFERAVGISKIMDPAMQGPAVLKGQEIDRNPGGMVFHDQVGAGSGVRPLYEVGPQVLSPLLESIRDVRQRIGRAFSADMWLMMAMGENDPQKTAREVAELHAEKLAMLAPLKARLDRELLKPTVEGVFLRLLRDGKLPPPPPELQGRELTIEFTNMMTAAQKMAGIAQIDRFIGTIQNIATTTGRPEILDRLDLDGTYDTYAAALSVPARMIVPKEKADEQRKARFAAEKATQQSAMMAEQAGAARDLANAPTDEPNALTALAGGARRAG